VGTWPRQRPGPFALVDVALAGDRRRVLGTCRLRRAIEFQLRSRSPRAARFRSPVKGRVSVAGQRQPRAATRGATRRVLVRPPGVRGPQGGRACPLCSSRRAATRGATRRSPRAEFVRSSSRRAATRGAMRRVLVRPPGVRGPQGGRACPLCSSRRAATSVRSAKGQPRKSRDGSSSRNP
jgi:hypothetical protein